MIKANESDYIKAHDAMNSFHTLYLDIIEQIMFGDDSSLIHLEIKKGKLLVIPEWRGHEHHDIEYEHIYCMGLKEDGIIRLTADERDAYIKNKCNEIEEILKAIKSQSKRATAREDSLLQLKETAPKAEPEEDGTYEIPDMFQTN
jgi:hypothetical protein